MGDRTVNAQRTEQQARWFLEDLFENVPWGVFNLKSRAASSVKTLPLKLSAWFIAHTLSDCYSRPGQLTGSFV